MEERVKKLLDKHKDDKDLTSEQDYIKPGWDWLGADLTGWNLEGLKLSTYDEKANFKNVFMVAANLKGVIFEGANLERATLGSSILENADFNNANLEGADFEGSDLKKSLFYRANLKKADFRGADLKDTNFMDSNLYKAILGGTNLQNAILTKCNLQEAYLGGANLENVDLHGSNLRDADFSEDTKLHNVNLFKCKIENSNLKFAFNQIDDKVIQERNSEKNYFEAKEVYRTLKNYFRQESIYDISGKYYYKEKLMEAKCNWKDKKYFKWISNMFLNLVAGYGERPLRVLIWWVGIILGYSFIYYFYNGIYIRMANNINSYNPKFLEALYFSIVTFTTLGFGDFAPKPGFFQLFASFEALLGAIFMAMFIFVFARKMIR